MNSTPPANKFSSYQIFAIVILALTQFTVVLDFMVMSPLGDMLMKTMELTTAQFGFAVSAYAFSAGISGFLTAGFADRFDRKKLLLFFYVGFVGGTLFCGLASTYFMLIAARIITGIFGGVIGSIAMAIVADLFPLEQRGRVMGFMQMGFGASQVLGIPIGLFLANIWGWQAPFIMIVGIAAIVWIIIIVKMQPITKHLSVQTDKSAFTHLIHTIAKRNYRIGFLATSFISLGGFLMMPWGSAFAINNLGVTYQQLPVLFMIAGIATLFIMPIIGKLSDRISKLKLFAGASLWMIVVVMIYTNLSITPFAVVVLFNVVMMMGIMSRMVPAMALVTALPELKDRGAFMSINSSLQQIAGGIAAGLGGMVVVQKTKFSPLEHYNHLGLLVVATTLLGIYLVYRVSKLIIAQQHKKVNVFVDGVAAADMK
jgi:predicted MFS family arabinose efflux permease